MSYFKTHAERRRWLAFQLKRVPDGTPAERATLWDRYSIYIMNTEEESVPKTFDQWLGP